MGTTAKSSPRFTPVSGRGLLDDEIELGKVVGVFGVRGEVRLHLHNREASILLQGPREVLLIAPDGRRSRTRLTCRPGAGKRILGHLDGLHGRDQAAGMKGTLLVLARAELPATEEGEFYVADLQGLHVLVEGEHRGRVVDVHHLPGTDVLELRVDGEELFVAFGDPAVGEIDLSAGTVVLDPLVLAADDDEDGSDDG